MARQRSRDVHQSLLATHLHLAAAFGDDETALLTEREEGNFRDGRQTERWFYPDDAVAWNSIFGG